MKKTTFSFDPCGYIMNIKRQSASAISKSTYVELIESVWKGKRLYINSKEKDDFLFWSLWLYHDHQDTISFRHIEKYICRADWISVKGKTTLYYCLALFKNSLTVWLRTEIDSDLCLSESVFLNTFKTVCEKRFRDKDEAEQNN